ncbi:alanyl-tRNA editing protein [Vibrio ziniensis]|uniref:Alanyl-tRNA editing protein n=1 Tax=Vibrio ziniensis TaxID=2711221 RepID=A0A6G7CG55_9VIBR|nr:alanyl-tRNA editing protein [Vibrio ziniensis]QIH41082.1 alanyl-tRNA editing protein [Vibrio ziniensis]
MSYTPTQVTFTQSIYQLASEVQFVRPHDEYLYVVSTQTPFHPVSHIWPDHPADRGTLAVDGCVYVVEDCLVGAINQDEHQLLVGKEILVKRDEPGWVFVVVHQIKTEENAVKVGDVVTLTVDEEYQNQLSRAHSAGHLAYLALNKVLASAYWRKDADRKDPHGHNDFNSYAQVTSFVTEDRCLDTYRLGKTLRKRGLNSADMLENLAKIEEQVNSQLSDWLKLGSKIEIIRQGDNLTDSRYWQCDLGEGEVAIIPCGGTHCDSLTSFGTMQVKLVQRDGEHIEMHTHVTQS